MKVQYDEQADAAYIELSTGKPDGAVEVDEGVILHTTNDHKIISIEILEASKKFPVGNLQHARKGRVSDEGWEPLEKKIKALSHLLYEMGMLLDAEKVLIDLARSHSNSSPSTHEFLGNMALESFLLHSRNIIEFLGYGNKCHKEDVLAKQYVSSWAVNKSELGNIQYKEGNTSVPGLLTDIHQHLSHLSYSRINGSIPWRWRAISDFLVSKMKVFLDNLEPDFQNTKEVGDLKQLLRSR